MSKLSRRLKEIELGVKDRSTKDTAFVGFEGVIAGSQGHTIAQWLAKEFNHNFDAYDSAVDAVYNDTHVGGSVYHHILDGNHSLWGAFEAVPDVKIDDSWVEELAQASEHLIRDGASISGVNPFFSLSPDQFDNLGSIVSSVGISKEFLADALTINGPEMLGGSLAMLVSLLMRKKADPGRLSYISGGCLLSALASGNPLLLPIAASGMVEAIKHGDSAKDIILQSGKGSLVSGSALLVSSLVGGPLWLGCIAGFMAATAISKGLSSPQKAFDLCVQIIEPAKIVTGSVIKSISGDMR
jgi:hypothetical protein